MPDPYRHLDHEPSRLQEALACVAYLLCVGGILFAAVFGMLLLPAAGPLGVTP